MDGAEEVGGLGQVLDGQLEEELLTQHARGDLLRQVESGGEPLALLDEVTQKDVSALLAFAEDDAGGLMDPRYARLRPEMSADEAITYLRRAAKDRPGLLYYAYVLDPESRLVLCRRLVREGLLRVSG